MEKTVKAWAVEFAPGVIETMIARDNGILFNPLCIFMTENEAIDWVNEKWHGGVEGGAVEIKQCKITL